MLFQNVGRSASKQNAMFSKRNLAPSKSNSVPPNYYIGPASVQPRLSFAIRALTEGLGRGSAGATFSEALQSMELTIEHQNRQAPSVLLCRVAQPGLLGIRESCLPDCSNAKTALPFYKPITHVKVGLRGTRWHRCSKSSGILISRIKPGLSMSKGTKDFLLLTDTGIY